MWIKCLPRGRDENNLANGKDVFWEFPGMTTSEELTECYGLDTIARTNRTDRTNSTD